MKAYKFIVMAILIVVHVHVYSTILAYGVCIAGVG